MNPSLKPYFNQLSLLHTSLGFGMVVTAMAAFVFRTRSGFVATSNLDWLVYAGPISGFACLLLSQALFTNLRKKALEPKELHQRITDYKSALIIRWVVLDFAAILNILCYLLTGNLLFLALSATLLLVFFLQKSSLKKLIKDLELSEHEIQIVNTQG